MIINQTIYNFIDILSTTKYMYRNWSGMKSEYKNMKEPLFIKVKDSASIWQVLQIHKRPNGYFVFLKDIKKEDDESNTPPEYKEISLSVKHIYDAHT